MIYQGNAITVERRDTLGGNDIAMLTFDLKDESVNKLSSAVMAELGNAVKAIQAESGLKGLMEKWCAARQRHGPMALLTIPSWASPRSLSRKSGRPRE